ncbi:MAG: helix-turn-helix transcriptional regulator [Alphaproteobacteria bacterium]|nr:helix-turn-helix transcriptional regulator [Alphaproteobacteria bacterium]
MSEREAFDAVLAALHEAAFDDSRWPDASGLVDEACGIKGNLLTHGAGASPDDHVVYLHRMCFRGERWPDAEAAYFEEYFARDERVPRLRALPDSRPAHAAGLFTDEEKKASVMWNEALPLMGMQDGLTVRLDGPGGSRIFWSLADPADGEGWTTRRVRRVERLLPHLRQFVRVRQALAEADGLNASLGALFDNYSAGVVQLDRRKRIVAANDRALDMLRATDGLLDRDGFLHARVSADDDRLQAALARALPPFPGAGATSSLTVTRPGGLLPLVLHVVPLGPREDNVSLASVAALVLAVDPNGRPPVDPALVAATLDLSPAQSRVAVLLAEGRSVRDIAAAIGRSENTVRWHIRRTFEKLGIGRLAQLIQLVRSLAGPAATKP